MGIQYVTWYWEIIRPIFGFFDEIVYGLFDTVIRGLFDISNLVTNSSLFTGIYKRIYVVVGIFMAFKLAFSFFQYLVDPDKFTDKSKGVGKLFMHVFIMLFALMFLPAVLFSGIGNSGEGLLSRAQKAFLPVLPKVILGSDYLTLGTGSSGSSFEDTIEITSTNLRKATLNTFFHRAYDLESVCDIRNYDLYEIDNAYQMRAKVSETCVVKGEKDGRVFILGKEIPFLDKTSKVYTYTYIPIISTAVGILILALFLAISIDLAKRCFKLVVLEIIAPIPIMSLIDPAAAKGESAFSKWSKNLISTFLDIFIKIGLVYIILVFLNLITDTVKGAVSGDPASQLFFGLPSTEDGTRFGYLVILLIIGLIYFAKEAPKFIKESLGMKADKGGLFDDVKSLAKTAGVVGGMGLGAGTAVLRNTGNSLRAGGASALNAFSNTQGGIGKKLGAALAHGTGATVGGLGGTLAAAVSGGAAGRKGVGKNGNPIGALSKGWSSQTQRSATRMDNATNGSTLMGRTAERARQAVTGRTGADLDKAQIDANKAVGDSFKSFDEFLGKKAANESLSHSWTDSSGATHTSNFSYGDFQRAVEHNDEAWALSNGFSSLTEAAGQAKAYGETAKGSAYTKYKGLAGLQSQLQEAANGGPIDSRLAAFGITDQASAAKELQTSQAFNLHNESYNQALHHAKLDSASSYKEMDQRKTTADNNTLSIQTRTSRTGANKYQRRQANAASTNRGKKK